VGVWRSGKRAATAHTGETLEGVGVGVGAVRRWEARRSVARLVRDERRICIWRAGTSTSE
jgi:hypothetical protein